MSPKACGRGTPVHGKLSLAKLAAGMRQRVRGRGGEGRSPGRGRYWPLSPGSSHIGALGSTPASRLCRCQGWMLRQRESPCATVPLQIAW